MLIPGVWAIGQFDSTKKFLSSQYKTKIPVYTQVITTIVHFLLCKWLIESKDMRETGAAIATNVTYLLNMIISDLWIRKNANTEFKYMIFWYDKTVVQNLGQFLKIGIPGMLMLCFEWWALELLAIFAGLIGVEELACQVVVITIIGFIFMLPLGISYAASALTGNYIGEGKIDLAKKFAQMTVFFNIICTTIIVVLLSVYQDAVSNVFTNEPKVIKIFNETLWVLLIYIWFDTIHGVQSGIIRGMGRQVYGSVFTLICYYILGMPLALLLCFKADMGIVGLWLGFTIASIILDFGFCLIISCPNWNEISKKIRSQVDDGKDVPMTPEVRFVKKMLTPKQSPINHEGGYALKGEYEEPNINGEPLKRTSKL